MKLTEEPLTLTFDVYRALIGHYVTLHIKEHEPLSGILTSFNGSLFHLTSNTVFPNTYVPLHNVVAISSDK